MAGKPAKRLQGFTPKKKAMFIAMLADGYTVTHAAERIGLSRRAAYNHRERDPEFATAWEEAYLESTELLEAEAYRRAVGWTETITDKDGGVRVVEKHSDLLLIFLLKARKPNVYRDRVDVTVDNRREIIVNLLPVVKDSVTGKLMLADSAQPSLLGSGEDG